MVFFNVSDYGIINIAKGYKLNLDGDGDPTGNNLSLTIDTSKGCRYCS
jgi:hypothetical protein